MKTFVLSIGLLNGKGRYPLALYEAPHLADDQAIARADMPGSLKLKNRVHTFSAKEMRDTFTGAIGTEDDLGRIGEQLFALLAQGDVGVRLRALMEEASSLALAGATEPMPPEPSRLVLDIAPLLLQALPWELATEQPGRQRLFANMAFPTCRGDRKLIAARPHTWPLRLMIVVGAKQGSEDNQIEAGPEVDAIRDVLLLREYDFDLNVLKQPNYSRLREELLSFKPHILHFIGHGGVEEGHDGVEGGDGYLEIDGRLSEDDDIEPWTPYTIRENLEDLRRLEEPGDLRLVVLNACRTDNAAQAGSWSDEAMKAGNWSVADAFLKAGVPAVIAMRSNIAGDDAARFSEAFYAALVSNTEPLGLGQMGAGSGIDAAVVQARRHVLQHRADGTQGRAWAAPSLQVQVDPDSVLQLDAVVGPQRRAAVDILTRKLQLRRLVDRWPQRYKLWREFGPRRKNVVVITGKEKVGKTVLARMMIERCALCSHELRYIDLRAVKESNPDKVINYLDVLRAIRDGYEHGEVPHDLTARLPASAFVEFNRKLNELLGAQQPAGAGLDDDWMASLPRSFERPERIFGPFCVALDRVVEGVRAGVAVPGANQLPLVFVIDHPEDLNSDVFTSFLWPRLISKFLRREDIGFVLLPKLDSEVQRFLARFKEDVQLIAPLTEFNRKQWPDLVIEHLLRTLDRHRFENRRDFWEYIDKARPNLEFLFGFYRIPELWTPEYLRKLPND